MRKALVIPKAIVAVICLIVALSLLLPTCGMMTKRMFGGGTLVFDEAEYKEYDVNRPVGGNVNYVLGAISGQSKDNAYYYLVPIKGKAINKDNPVETLVLVKAINGSDYYNQLNDVYRDSKGENSKKAVKLSGVMKKSTSKEKEIAEQLRKASPFKSYNLSEYTIDLTTPVKKITINFILSLLVLIVAVFFVVQTLESIKRNADVDRIEEDRIAYRLEQERKSGNKNEDGTDKMFGDSDASYGVTPRRDDDMSQEGGYNPTFQSQGGEDYQPSSSGGGFLSDDDDYSGSSGGFLSDDDNYSGNSGGFLSDDGYDDNNSGGYYGNDYSNNGYNNDYNDYGSQGGYYGDSNQQDEQDYDGFFGG